MVCMNNVNLHNDEVGKFGADGLGLRLPWVNDQSGLEWISTCAC